MRQIVSGDDDSSDEVPDEEQTPDDKQIEGTIDDKEREQTPDEEQHTPIPDDKQIERDLPTTDIVDEKTEQQPQQKRQHTVGKIREETGVTVKRTSITIEKRLLRRYKQFCEERQQPFSHRLTSMMKQDTEFIEWSS